MSKHSDEIRNKYIKIHPEGMTADDIRHMSEMICLTWITFKRRRCV